MTATRTIPIAFDPKRAQLQADEDRMARMAELQDRMFYSRLVNGMRERQIQSSPTETSKFHKNSLLMEKLPSTHQQLPVSILMSQTNPSFAALKSLSPKPIEDFDQAQISSVLTKSLQILEDDVVGVVDEDELMFEMDF